VNVNADFLLNALFGPIGADTTGQNALLSPVSGTSDSFGLFQGALNVGAADASGLQALDGTPVLDLGPTPGLAPTRTADDLGIGSVPPVDQGFFIPESFSVALAAQGTPTLAVGGVLPKQSAANLAGGDMPAAVFGKATGLEILGAEAARLSGGAATPVQSSPALAPTADAALSDAGNIPGQQDASGPVSHADTPAQGPASGAPLAAGADPNAAPDTLSTAAREAGTRPDIVSGGPSDGTVAVSGDQRAAATAGAAGPNAQSAVNTAASASISTSFQGNMDASPAAGDTPSQIASKPTTAAQGTAGQVGAAADSQAMADQTPDNVQPLVLVQQDVPKILSGDGKGNPLLQTPAKHSAYGGLTGSQSGLSGAMTSANAQASAHAAAGLGAGASASTSAAAASAADMGAAAAPLISSAATTAAQASGNTPFGDPLGGQSQGQPQGQGQREGQPQDQGQSASASAQTGTRAAKGATATQSALSLEQLAFRTGYADPLAAGIFTPGADRILESVAPFFGGTPNAALGQQAVRQVKVQIGQAIKNGESEFTVRLDPPELGRVTVKLNFQTDGGLKASIFADNQDTLNLLKRDQKALADILAETGHDVDADALDYQLDDQNQKSAGRALAEAMLEDRIYGDDADDAAMAGSQATDTDHASHQAHNPDDDQTHNQPHNHPMADADIAAILSRVDLSTGLDIRV